MMGALFFTVFGLGSLAVAHEHADHDRIGPAIGWTAAGCVTLLIAVVAASVL